MSPRACRGLCPCAWHRWVLHRSRDARASGLTSQIRYKEVIPSIGGELQIEFECMAAFLSVLVPNETINQPLVEKCLSFVATAGMVSLPGQLTFFPAGRAILDEGRARIAAFAASHAQHKVSNEVTETLTAAVTGLRRRLAGIWDDSHTTLQDQCKSFLQLLKNAEAGDVTPDVAAKATVALRAFAADAVQVAANEVLLPGWCTVRIRVDLV